MHSSAPDDDRSARSPAVGLTLVLGLLGLVTALNPGAFAVSLFLCAAALAALPMALADRPGPASLRFALLGAASAVLGLVLVLVPLLGGELGRAARTQDPLQVDDRPVVPGPAPVRSAPAGPSGATAPPP